MENSKTFTIFAGINGAGKSTLYYTLGPDNFGVRLNTDEIVKENGKDWRDASAQFEAAKILFEKQKECFEKGISLNRETTLAGYNIIKTIREAKALSYKINLIYIGVNDLSLAKKRVNERVSKGGHGVSEKVMDVRFSHMMDNLIKIFPECDKVQLFDNSENGFNLVGYKFNNEIVKIKDCKWLNNIINDLDQNKTMQ